jgi:enoyl-CoA hydratase
MDKNQTSASPAAGRVHWSLQQGVAWVVLDNPAKRNAISLDMWRTLRQALADLDADAAVRCVVIRGEGDGAFCAGADVAEKQGLDAAQAEADLQVSLDGLKALRVFSKPLVAMVSGYCLGAGVAIALSCDLRIAAAGSTFSIPAAKLGLAYQYSEVKRLVDLVGTSNAMRMLFTADRVAAQQALQTGLVTEVVEAGELHTNVGELARRIAANAPLSLAAAKYAVGQAVAGGGPDLEGCLARARACYASGDYAEGRLAFRERRAPVFLGR